jgi:hypothetical protein
MRTGVPLSGALMGDPPLMRSLGWRASGVRGATRHDWAQRRRSWVRRAFRKTTTVTESPRVPIPEHLVESLRETAGYRLASSCDAGWSDATRDAVVDAALVWYAFSNRTLTPKQTAALAGDAAAWLEPLWPDTIEKIGHAHTLLHETRDLLQLRDLALAVAGEPPYSERGDAEIAEK